MGSAKMKFLLISVLCIVYACPSYGSISKTTKRNCKTYRIAVHNLLLSINDLDRGSRFYTSVSKMRKIIRLLDKTLKYQKNFEKKASEFDDYIKNNKSSLNNEGLSGLIKMRRELRYGIGRRHGVKLKKYLIAFRKLLMFSKDNLKKIKSGNKMLRTLYDKYYLGYKKEYTLYKKTYNNYKKFIKRYYKKYEVLNDIIPMPDRLFDDSIWDLNKVKFLGN